MKKINFVSIILLLKVCEERLPARGKELPRRKTAGAVKSFASCLVVVFSRYNRLLSILRKGGMILKSLGLIPKLVIGILAGILIGTMVAAPGVPGGSVMAALGLLQTMLGFDQTLLSLMIALYVAQDSFGTACNVTGDGGDRGSRQQDLRRTRGGVGKACRPECRLDARR
jgi:hypothetical protein